MSQVVDCSVKNPFDGLDVNLEVSFAFKRKVTQLKRKTSRDNTLNGEPSLINPQFMHVSRSVEIYINDSTLADTRPAFI